MADDGHRQGSIEIAFRLYFAAMLNNAEMNRVGVHKPSLRWWLAGVGAVLVSLSIAVSAAGSASPRGWLDFSGSSSTHPGSDSGHSSWLTGEHRTTRSSHRGNYPDEDLISRFDERVPGTWRRCNFGPADWISYDIDAGGVLNTMFRRTIVWAAPDMNNALALTLQYSQPSCGSEPCDAPHERLEVVVVETHSHHWWQSVRSICPSWSEHAS